MFKIGPWNLLIIALFKKKGIETNIVWNEKVVELTKIELGMVLSWARKAAECKGTLDGVVFF
jgi:hypothetical protein